MSSGSHRESPSHSHVPLSANFLPASLHHLASRAPHLPCPANDMYVRVSRHVSKRHMRACKQMHLCTLTKTRHVPAQYMNTLRPLGSVYFVNSPSLTLDPSTCSNSVSTGRAPALSVVNTRSSNATSVRGRCGDRAIWRGGFGGGGAWGWVRGRGWGAGTGVGLGEEGVVDCQSQCSVVWHQGGITIPSFKGHVACRKQGASIDPPQHMQPSPSN